MATQPTQNPVPSESPRDLKFNAGKIDEFVTSLAQQYQDRFGNNHYTIEGIRWLAQQAIAQFGYITIDSFQAGATISLPNQVLRDTSTGEYYRWDGQLPKVVASGSTPASSGGIGLGKWLSVGAAVIGSQQDGAGDALVAVKQPFSGATVRTQHDKNAETVSLTDFSVAGDGSTDDTAGINAAIASLGTTGGTVLIPKYVNGFERRYLVPDWSKIVNPYGVQLIGKGSVVSAESVGGYTQRNLYGNQFKVSYGHEYLYRVYKRMELGQQAQVFLFGDSTVQGGNGEDAAYSTGTLVFDMFQAAGLNVNITNRGVAGTSWYQMDAVPDISATSDLFIIKYGINDGGTPGSGDRFANYAASIRSKLAQIRSTTNGGVNTLSIIVVGPNSTNDTQHNRDALWYEPQREIILQACRDYQCAYFDTYGMMPDVKNAAGFAMDNPFSNGQGVHPMNTMQSWIWGNVLNTFFSAYATEKYRSNNFLNVSSSAGTPNVATVLTNYKKGTSFYRVTVAGGWPFEGFVTVDRSADDAGVQRLAGFANLASKSVQRTWNTTTGTWNSWTGTAVGLTPANGWSATTAPEVRVSDNGLVTISAKLTGGTTATGTQVLSGLPSNLRPPVEKRFACTNDNGTHTCVGVNANTGSIFIVGSATDATAGFHINISYYIN